MKNNKRPKGEWILLSKEEPKGDKYVFSLILSEEGFFIPSTDKAETVRRKQYEYKGKIYKFVAWMDIPKFPKIEGARNV